MPAFNRRALFFFLLLFTPFAVKAKTNLSVPFSAQAPYGTWEQPWQDACEETAILMVDRFYQHKNLGTETAYQEILRILRIKENAFGQSYDENAQTVADIINNFFPWEAHIVVRPTIDRIKNEIDAGRPVIVPAYGKGLLNPYFTDGGPYYHMNVISGYDDETNEFIVQEPGTSAGLDFRYPYDRIIDAMHDYLPNQRTIFGRKAAIFTQSAATEASLATDGDKDGLVKEDELRFGTILWLADSDGDGYSDGMEVVTGHSPTNPYRSMSSNDYLVKTANDPKVYVVEDGTKRHIANETAFLSRGWQWSQIVVLSDMLIEQFTTGETVN